MSKKGVGERQRSDSPHTNLGVCIFWDYIKFYNNVWGVLYPTPQNKPNLPPKIEILYTYPQKSLDILVGYDRTHEKSLFFIIVSTLYWLLN